MLGEGKENLKIKRGVFGRAFWEAVVEECWCRGCRRYDRGEFFEIFGGGVVCVCVYVFVCGMRFV